MRKVIFTLVLILVIMMSLLVMTHATTALANVECDIDYLENSVVIHGETGKANARVMLVVTNPGKELAEVDDDISALQYQTEVVTDENGVFVGNFLLNMEDDPEEDMVYNVYAKRFGAEPEKIASITYKSNVYRYEILKKLKGSSSEILDVLEDIEGRRCLGIDKLISETEIDLVLLCELAVGKFNEYEETPEGFRKSIVQMRELCVVQLFNQGKISKIFDENGNYLLERFLDFEVYDDKNETTFYECYKNVVKKRKRAEIYNSLSKQAFESSADLFEDFAVSTVLIGITNPDAMGYGHVEQLLTDANAEFIGIGLNKKINSDVQARIAAYKGFTSVKELEDFINNSDAKTDSNKKPVSSGGFGPIMASPDYLEKPEVKSDIFVDIQEDHWAFEAIVYLKSKGVINGVDDSHFDPDALVTREQFVKMIFGILGQRPLINEKSSFVDVAENEWYTPYVVSAFKEGYISGISEDMFGTGLYATREQICTVIARMLGITALSEADFSDSSSISYWASDAVAALNEKNIVGGYPDGSFRPDANCTRAEVATIIYRASAYMEVK